MSQALFGELSTQDFLNKHWQQKPLLVRHAFELPELSFDAGELAGLACDTEAPARIVIEHGEKPWQLKQGPFQETDFTSLPATHWSLLINDIETYFPELNAFIEPFRFIPDWRIDDLMISYAADLGSVGPHVDDYDVFLIQLDGIRRWSIDENPEFDSTALEGPELKILKNPATTQSWELHPGDMLYLPPNMPHHGVAQGECMTLSVGFRAPSSGELVQAWLDDIGDTAAFKARFSDQQRELQNNPGEITQHDLKRLREILIEGIEKSSGGLDIWLGKYLTENKRPDPNILEAMSEQFAEAFEEGESYQRFPGTRAAYTLNKNQIQLFVGGLEYSLDEKHIRAVEYLCRELEYEASAIATFCHDTEIRELINTLINNNNIVLMEHSPCDYSKEPYS